MEAAEPGEEVAGRLIQGRKDLEKDLEAHSLGAVKERTQTPRLPAEALVDGDHRGSTPLDQLAQQGGHPPLIRRKHHGRDDTTSVRDANGAAGRAGPPRSGREEILFLVMRIFLDAFHGLDRCLDRGWRALVLALLGLAAGWWVYVPLHELLHAAACVAAGGEVSRLEIAPEYGGALLARLFPFITSGSDYAGRLSGFDTHGSDLVYLATDLGPFLLTLYPGVWALRRAGARGWPFQLGFSLPFALAPFLSLTGDAYEIGSILVTQGPLWGEALRGDDLIKKAQELAALSAGAPWGGFALAALVGLAWATLWCELGGQVARALGRGPTPPRIAVRS